MTVSVRPNGSSAGRRAMAGLSLIEVMVALFVIMVGLLGIAGLQAYSLKNNLSAYHRSVANGLIYDVFDSMRANREVALTAAYAVALDDTAADFCSGTDQLDQDVCNWLWRVGNQLPSGAGMVSCNAAGGAQQALCTVTVRWNDTRGQGEGATQEMTASSLL